MGRWAFTPAIDPFDGQQSLPRVQLGNQVLAVVCPVEHAHAIEHAQNFLHPK